MDTQRWGSWGRGGRPLVIWFRVVRKLRYTGFIRDSKGKGLVVAMQGINTSSNPTWGKLYCVIWIWFKGFDEFLTSSLSMAWGKDLFVWINLAFSIYYELVYPNEFL